jgi:hypothetical protein
MAGPDAASSYVVSYLDVFDLFDLIAREWQLFSFALPRQEAWAGRVRELRDIRHRIAHCRLPHTDDLSRLLQALRDLEHGARTACAAFNAHEYPDKMSTDRVVRAWGPSAARDNQHLIDHAQRQYATRFALRWSRRPWAGERGSRRRVSGVPGYLWHARFVIREETIDPLLLWNDDMLDGVREAVLLATFHPSRVTFAFSASEDPKVIVEAIDLIFQAVLERENYATERTSAIFYDPLQAASLLLPPKVHVATPWAMVEDSVNVYDIFSGHA